MQSARTLAVCLGIGIFAAPALLFAVPEAKITLDSPSLRSLALPVAPALMGGPARLLESPAERRLVSDSVRAQRRIFRRIDAPASAAVAEPERLRIPEAAATVEWMSRELASRRELYAKRPIVVEAIRGVEDEVAALQAPEGPDYEALLKAVWKFAQVMDYEYGQDPCALLLNLSSLSTDTRFLEFLKRPRENGLLIPVPQELLESKAVFVQVSGMPVHFIGLVTKRTDVDGTSFSPFDFLYHDLGHIYARSIAQAEAIRASGLSRVEAERKIAAIHRAVRREISRISDAELRRQAIDVWFEFDHEEGFAYPTPADYAARVSGPGRFLGGQPIDGALMLRLQRAHERAERRFSPPN